MPSLPGDTYGGSWQAGWASSRRVDWIVAIAIQMG